jgi:hypothetical protein
LSEEGIKQQTLGAPKFALNDAFALAAGRTRDDSILLVMLGLLSAWNTVTAAHDFTGWCQNAINSIMAFLKAGQVSPLYSCMVGTDYRTWRRRVESPLRGADSLG